MPSPSLLQRLKERKLVQWALAYLAGAWVLFEVSDAVGGRLEWPDVLYQALLVVLGIGFFVTLVLAWYHGEKGRQRVSGPELLMVAALLVVAGVALSTLGLDTSLGPSPPFPAREAGDDRPRIAVLPFDNFSPDPDDAYFADGMHDEILSKLSGISALRVISRSSVEQYRENRPAVPRIAADLGVDYLVEGSARLAGGLVRLTVQLIRAQTDEHLWAEDFDREFSVEDLIDIQSEIAREVASRLAVVITPGEMGRIDARPTENLEAWELYQRAEATWVRALNAAEAGEVTPLYRRALDLDPDFAEAWAGLARAKAWAYWRFSEDELDLLAAGQALDQAIALDPDGVLTHHARGFYHYYGLQEYDEALGYFQVALEARPSFADAQVRVASLLRRMGRWEHSIDAYRRARGLDPRSAGPAFSLGLTLAWAGEVGEAEHFMDLGRAIQPGVESYHWWRLLIQLGHQGDTVTARQWVEGLPGGVLPRVQSALGAQVAVWRGDFEGALEGTLPPPVDMDPFDPAMIHALLGDPVRSVAAADTLIPEGFSPEMRPADVPMPRLGSFARADLYRMGWIMLLRGEPETARAWVQEYLRRVPLEKDAMWGMRALVNAARLHALSGDHEGALDHLKTILSHPAPLGPAGVLIDPAFSSIRSHPRFQALLETYADDVER